MSQPPGASYQVSNALIVAKRKLWKLEDPVRILFNDQWKAGNELFDWYERRQGNNRFIHTIQLRKERESPFFHEYIAFRLKGDSSNYFRIDRRQRRDESLPMNAIYNDGVEAHDTIDNVTSLDDRSYGASDCLVEITFKEDVQVHLLLLLKICRAIAHHQHSKVYTLQRYNCYFYAQTIMLCTVCAISDWDGTQSVNRAAEAGAKRWKSPNSADPGVYLESISEPKATENLRDTLHDTLPSNTKLDYSWDHLSLLALDVVKTSPFLTHADNCTHCRESQSPHRQRSLSSEIDRLKASLSSHWDAVYRSYIDRVHDESYKNIVCGGVWELKVEDKSKEMCDQLVTKESAEIKAKWDEYEKEKLTNLTTTLRDLLEPTEVCDAWEPEPDIWKSIWASNIGAPFQRVVKDWEDKTTAFFTSAYPEITKSLNSQAGNSCSKAHESAINARMESFKQRMVIRQVEIKAATTDYEQKEMTELALVPDGRPAPIHRRIGGAIAGLVKGSKYGSPREVQLNDMQDFIIALIRAHSVRVEQYKVWLKCDAKDVENDIRVTMNEIWTAVIY